MVLSADFRFCTPDYINDHTWEVEPGVGDFAALAVSTTYGLRARTMRIFLSFKLDGRSVTHPQKFFSPPRLQHFYPNFMAFTFSPFQGVEAQVEYWLPSSQTLASRLTFRNQGSVDLEMQLEVCGLLVPLEGQSMAPVKIQSVNVLSGRTSGLEPVVFLTGGPVAGTGPYPSLLLNINLGPLASRQFTWVQAALPEAQDSFDLARRTSAGLWDAERSRIMLTNAAQIVDIETWDPEWDAALAFSQKTALRLFLSGNEHLPQASFVLARQPDHGYSSRGDGRDHASLWSGQTMVDTLYLASLLPGAPNLVAGLVRNFIACQDEKGFMDCRPGLAGQRGRSLATPLLASLTWNTFRQSGDVAFLREVFPGLLAFLSLWFSQENDRDGDGFPEWTQPIQTGFEENPAFSSWHKEDQGADINFFETPALAAYLWQEYQCLANIARELDCSERLESLHVQAEALRSAVSSCWNKTSHFYQVRDRDTHLCLKGKPVLTCTGPGTHSLKKEFKQPVRLLFRVLEASRATRGVDVRIQGQSSAGGTQEHLERKDFHWNMDVAVATSRQVYTALDEIEVTGLNPSDRLVIRTVDCTQEDQTGFLPLWAGIADKKQVSALVRLKLFDPKNFWFPSGFSSRSLASDGPSTPENMEIQFPWNQLIAEGLLAYDLRTEAAQLVTRLMKTSTLSLKRHGAFYNSYQASSGEGMGERNSLRGLAPVGLFLKILGVQIISANKVRLEGKNPFPWPVTLRYRGLVVIRQVKYTDITFPDGKTIRVTDPSPCLVTNI
jgi:hypothetical protein